MHPEVNRIKHIDRRIKSPTLNLEDALTNVEFCDPYIAFSYIVYIGMQLLMPHAIFI